MYIIIAAIQIKEGFKEQYIDGLIENASSAVKDEPGCLRFDVLQDSEDDNTIHLYEVYQDQAAVDAHRAAPHFTKWREECADWFDGEITRKVGAPVYPPDSVWSKRQPVP